ncbi:MAG: hypothetical protein UV53_C0002G0017 [Candidatus Azambacteria bacterium GW2011_GWE1_42_9]|nr:MAG: hypothetical protein UU33_C0001G0064 [Candidatus Azambacteria bacterium GW2011_GWF1_41_10]KKS49163.1 MAG: hypothetical protein UV14_C0002G0160 [Candidatus Azambacteria bacterium GW2011_GWF2_42_22]KKS73769.1 MAG: hypothetical protein UV45_C0024G0006 [Candidatus Azambacteria bacterium GW2011_GWB1_42_72]KKS79711.1 MAG: hypothetical protein UV53_C0002G0017 [Candidatus Azambacteria bacterium GW2011_GWE1_42_9]KKT03258.1 MAG: hypothetical protein UV81_C0002G0011 [Candidatus Azambacteria bacter
MSISLVTIAAVIDSVNFCAFSVLILTIAFLFNAGKTRTNIIKIGGVYIAGIFLIYVSIGLGIMRALNFFNVPHFMGKIGAAILILAGAISILNEFFPAFPIKLKIPAFIKPKMATLIEKGSIPAAFFLGVLVGLYEFPCTGGPYLMILGLLHDQATFAKGLVYLIYYNLVFVSPLVIALLIASNKTLLAKMQSWKEDGNIRIKLWSGIAMIILGIAIFVL